MCIRDRDEIADGTAEEVTTLKDFYNRFQPLLEHAYENMEKKELEKVGEICPDCGCLLYTSRCV